MFPWQSLPTALSLSQEDVRKDLLHADVVLPSLDGASEEVFHYINRPHPLITLPAIISGLKEFRREYAGRMWLGGHAHQGCE